MSIYQIAADHRKQANGSDNLKRPSRHYAPLLPYLVQHSDRRSNSLDASGPHLMGRRHERDGRTEHALIANDPTPWHSAAELLARRGLWLRLHALEGWRYSR